MALGEFSRGAQLRHFASIHRPRRSASPEPNAPPHSPDTPQTATALAGGGWHWQLVASVARQEEAMQQMKGKLWCSRHFPDELGAIATFCLNSPAPALGCFGASNAPGRVISSRGGHHGYVGHLSANRIQSQLPAIFHNNLCRHAIQAPRRFKRFPHDVFFLTKARMLAMEPEQTPCRSAANESSDTVHRF